MVSGSAGCTPCGCPCLEVGIRLLQGELNPMVALMTRRIKVEGDVQSLVFLRDLI
jgi:putative sterol carrier protein